MSGTFTERVRQEVGRAPLGGADEQTGELSALLRLAGGLHLAGADDGPTRIQIELSTTSGAVARRAYALLGARFDVQPELRVLAAGGVRTTTTYGLLVIDGAEDVGRASNLLDDRGRPVHTFPQDWVESAAMGTAVLRGAILAAGSFSTPGRATHVEVGVPSPEVAEQLASIAMHRTGHRPGASATTRERWRVVWKSAEAVGDLLVAIGAAGAFMVWDEQRNRRQVRAEATRLANADAANVRRAVEAAAQQTAAVERALEQHGWDALDDDLRHVALARLANPEASLTDLADIVGVGRSTVYRRLQRLVDLAGE